MNKLVDKLLGLYELDDINAWKNAEDDKDEDIRFEAYRKTINWTKAEDDESWDIRLAAYKNTGNWTKASHDMKAEIRLEAKKHVHSNFAIDEQTNNLYSL